MVISPMKPFSGGMPIELSAAIRKTMVKTGITLQQPAVLGDLARVPPLVNHAHDQEEHAGRDAVIDLLQDRARDARRIQRENAQRAEAQVAHRGVGHQLLPVLLHQADQRAVDDADDRENRHRR